MKKKATKKPKKPPAPKPRTSQQNRAMHLWFKQKADQCRDAGVTVQMAFAKTIELEMTEGVMKEIWRTVQKAIFRKVSTAELTKQGEIDEVAEHLNRFFSEKFNLPGLPIPSHELNYWDSAPTK